ncbi:MAG: septum formation inhibitor Maf [Flavobacteriaceae bacterium]|nr:septum formation inhibitor Maf [Flavobacteriaceae bacterium]|tara:strand:+ start:7251 stop:8138 length:888 start_codon:yes stop_codon:yes gene_type:complete
MKNFILLTILFLFSCEDSLNNQDALSQNFKEFSLTDDFKKYWFTGTAEISSYELFQFRYNEIRKGVALLIYVTEDFLIDDQVKANNKSELSYLVLKSNRLKNFLTGIYPYSIMNSSFNRLGVYPNLVKASTSIQEWCGQSYLQLNRKEKLFIQRHSYFENEADQEFVLKSYMTEDEIWNQIRINPKDLPLEYFKMLPSLESLQMKHQNITVQNVLGKLTLKNNISTYSINYIDLNTILEIDFQTDFPHIIEGWRKINKKDSIKSIEASRKITKRLPYWELNKLGDEKYRQILEIF